MKLHLNITLQGVSADHTLEFDVEPRDEDVKRVAVELVRSGDLPGLHVGGLSEDAFDSYVVDRFKGWRHSGHITLQRGERSRLADHAAEVL